MTSTMTSLLQYVTICHEPWVIHQSKTSFMVVVTGYTHNGDHWAVPETMVTLDCEGCFMDGVTPARHGRLPQESGQVK